MKPEIAVIIEACQWEPSYFLIISENVFSPLLYYSHLGSVIPAVLIAGYIFFKGRKELANKLLFLTVFCFAVWVFSDMVTWATEYPAHTMFFWTILIIFEPLVYFFAFYFFYAFVYKKDLTPTQKILFSLPLLPIFILAPTKFALLGYNLSDCDRNAYEGIMTSYGYLVEILYAALIVYFAIAVLLKNKIREDKNKIILLTIGITAFLLSFSLGNILGVFTENWTIGQYGLFGAPIFTAFLAYLIVRYRAFNVRLIGAQALVIALWLLVFATLFIRNIEDIRIVVSATLILILILGIFLVRGVKREIVQRERIEDLAKDLEETNKQQIILVHFLTHQIKGFVSKSRNIFSMVLDGDFGPVPEAMKPIVEEGLKSDTKGVDTIQEILNAANIKSGKISYTKTEIDLTALVTEIVQELKIGGDIKGIAIDVSLPPDMPKIMGDKLQLHNAFKNLIDNSIKYTPSGSVEVTSKEEEGTLQIIVKDTGVGITEGDMKNLFTQGGHGKDSQKINVDSTGFGLFIVKNIIESHGGKVWATSEGAGKGSMFTVELPVVVSA